MPKVKGGIGPNHRLRDERRQRGWSQQEVADRLGTTANTVSRWELGTTYPDPFFRARLCDLFGKSAAELGLPPPKEKDAGQALSAPLPVLSRVHPAASANEDMPTESASRGVQDFFLYDPAIPRTGKYPLFGRATLLQHLRHTLCETEPAPTLALHGLPGVGKTALAVELAHDTTVRAHFSGGLLWAALGTSPNSTAVLSRWGTLLGMSTGQAAQLASPAAWMMALRSLIDTRSMLIILDDVWQSQDIQPFLVGGPRCAYLITTRHPEIATRIAHRGVLQVEELGLEDGARLLLELAPDVPDADHQTLPKLVQAVGGLPLALVLMGNYLRVHTYSQQPGRVWRAIARLHDPQARLTLAQPGDPFTNPSIQPSAVVSLHTVIGVSDAALNHESRRALQALASLPPKPNTFSEEAALAIAGIQAEALDTLCDAGLLESRGSGRYTLHQTVVDYAHARGTDSQAEERLIACYTTLLQSSHTHDASLEDEVKNILAAFQLACQHAQWATLLAGIDDFAPFLAVRGTYPIVKPYLLQAQQALLQDCNASSDLPVSICLHLGRIADFQGAYTEASESYATGWEYARSCGDEHLKVLLLAYWGEMLNNAGRYQLAEQVLIQGLQLAQAARANRQTCTFLKNLGEVAASLGNIAQAIRYHEQGLVLARQLEDWELVSILLQNLAAHQAWQGNFSQAEASYREALTHARAIGHLQRCSAALSGLGFTLVRQGRLSEAEACLHESLALARTIHSPVRTGCALQNLGIVKSEQGDYAAAEAYLHESLDVATSIGHTWLISETLYYWGELLLKQERLQEAHATFEQAFKQAREHQEQELIALTTFGLARVLWLQGEVHPAKELGCKSQALFLAMEHEQAANTRLWLQDRITI